jgi:hypothetical protein
MDRNERNAQREALKTWLNETDLPGFEITASTRGFESTEAREEGIRALRAQGHRYFTRYKDVQGFAISIDPTESSTFPCYRPVPA